MGYSPDRLVLTLSRECNSDCGHCIIDAGPEHKERLDKNTINNTIQEAKIARFNHLVIYGGEPFLMINDLLPYTIKKGIEADLHISIGTNGFWGVTPENAKKTLDIIENTAKDSNHPVNIGISVDKYHQPTIPVRSIANIIAQYTLREYKNINLHIQTFGEQESWDVLGQVHELCPELGIVLLETNDKQDLLAIETSNLLEFNDKNLPIIKEKLDVSEDTSEQDLKSILYLEVNTPYSRFVARSFDIGDGKKDYLAFLEDGKQIGLSVEKRVVKAGRANGNKVEELCTEYADGNNYLIISPQRKAFAYPAQIISTEGVDIIDKNIGEIIFEVGNKLVNSS